MQFQALMFLFCWSVNSSLVLKKCSACKVARYCGSICQVSYSYTLTYIIYWSGCSDEKNVRRDWRLAVLSMSASCTPLIFLQTFYKRLGIFRQIVECGWTANRWQTALRRELKINVDKYTCPCSAFIYIHTCLNFLSPINFLYKSVYIWCFVGLWDNH